MNDYLKKVIILKLVDGSKNTPIGSVKLLRENGEVNMYVELLKIADYRSIDLYWCVCGENKIAMGELPLAHSFKVKLDCDFLFLNSASFCVYSKCNLDVLAYGNYGENACDLSYIKSYLKTKNEKENNENSLCYDDELIANENYYNNDYEKLLHNQIFDFENCAEKENSKTQNASELFYNEACACSQKEYGYYERIKDKLDSLLSSSTPIKELNDIIDGGYFVKIPYDNTRHYAVGKITKNGSVKYVCYGVLGVYGEKPFNEKSRFIPISLFSNCNSGYYIIFQNASTSEIV